MTYEHDSRIQSGVIELHAEGFGRANGTAHHNKVVTRLCAFQSHIYLMAIVQDPFGMDGQVKRSLGKMLRDMRP